jgi:hypothetical protein
MRKTILITLVAFLVFAATAAAKAPRFYVPKTHHACKAHYVKRTVRIAKRHHGKLVRRHHRIVMVKQTRCVYVAPKRATTTPAPAAVPVRVRAGIDPSYVQDPADNLIVTWSYSASAPVPLPDGTLSIAITEPNKAGKSGGCSMNVGGDTTGGDCTVELSRYGDWNVTVSYASSDSSVAPATSTDTEDIEPLPVTTSSAPTTTSLSLGYGTVHSETGPPPMNWIYEYGSATVSVSSSDPANDGFAVSLVITNGPNTRTLTGSVHGTICALGFTRIDGFNAPPNTSVSGCGIPDTELAGGDELTVSVTTNGSPGYAGASSDAQAITPPWSF